MCKATTYVDELLIFQNRVNNEYLKYCEELSNVNKLQEDILHALEGAKTLSASDGYMYVRALKDIREKRRKIKNQIESSQSLYSRITKFQEIKIQLF